VLHGAYAALQLDLSEHIVHFCAILRLKSHPKLDFSCINTFLSNKIEQVLPISRTVVLGDL
jgi:hypothetical protein